MPLRQSNMTDGEGKGIAAALRQVWDAPAWGAMQKDLTRAGNSGYKSP